MSATLTTSVPIRIQYVWSLMRCAAHSESVFATPLKGYEGTIHSTFSYPYPRNKLFVVRHFAYFLGYYDYDVTAFTPGAARLQAAVQPSQPAPSCTWLTMCMADLVGPPAIRFATAV